VDIKSAPIDYFGKESADVIVRLSTQIELGEVSFKPRGGFGYLLDLLKALDVPVESQTLVFSRTSLQEQLISPKNPRAVYFNDEVAVGWIPGSPLLEIAAHDPVKGAMFYTLPQPADDNPLRKIAFHREERCVECHLSHATLSVPGYMLRSMQVDEFGERDAQGDYADVTHSVPHAKRWGGWYVTGTSGGQTHMGRAVSALDTSPLPAATSDIVAHLVLAHQTQMHNLITQTNYQTRLALYAEDARNKALNLPAGTISEAARQRFERPAEALVRYLLFANEAPLEDGVDGGSGFAEEFAAKGPRDARGRSLREFDLRKRIFKYPCSYLIYSEAFDAIPGPAKDYIYRRLFEVLSGREQGPEFASLSGEDRKAILEILVATKAGVPEEWKQSIQAVNRKP